MRGSAQPADPILQSISKTCTGGCTAVAHIMRLLPEPGSPCKQIVFGFQLGIMDLPCAECVIAVSGELKERFEIPEDVWLSSRKVDYDVSGSLLDDYFI